MSRQTVMRVVVILAVAIVVVIGLRMAKGKKLATPVTE